MSQINSRAIIPPQAYGVLNSTACERVIQSTNSRYFQWYLVGQRRVRGYSYVYKSVAHAHVNVLWFSILIGTICMITFLDHLSDSIFTY